MFVLQLSFNAVQEESFGCLQQVETIGTVLTVVFLFVLAIIRPIFYKLIAKNFISHFN